MNHISCTVFDRSDKTTTKGDVADLAAIIRHPERFAWVDIQGEDLGEAIRIAEVAGLAIHPEDHFGRPEVLPRFEERPDHLSFYAYEVLHPEGHLDTAAGVTPIEFVRLLIVLGKDVVITFHRRNVEAVAEVADSCAASFRDVGQSPTFIVFLLLQEGLQDLAQLNLANDNYLDHLEERVIEPGETRLPADFVIAGRNILTLKRLASSLHVVLTRLGTRSTPFVSEPGRKSFHLMLDTAIATREAIDSSRSLLDGVLAAMQAEAANRTSEIARILTIISGVLLPVSVIAGIYGMNFEGMPELKWPYGYAFALGLMATVATVQLFAFWRLGWIGRKRDPSGGPL